MSQVFANTFRRISILLLAIIITLPSLHTEEQASYDIELGRQSIVDLTRHIKQRDDRPGEAIIRHPSYINRCYSMLHGVNVITFSIT